MKVVLKLHYILEVDTIEDTNIDVAQAEAFELIEDFTKFDDDRITILRRDENVSEWQYPRTRESE